MNKGIEWALEKAREDLRLCGEVYRDQECRSKWIKRGVSTDERRIKFYEDKASNLRQVIADLEFAARVVVVDLKGVA